jgi:hypothetical protein
MDAVAWPQIETSARAIFSIWSGAPELEWAHSAWFILAENDLTTYSNEVTRVTVLARLLGLGVLYHNFSRRAWQAGDVQLLYWSEDCDLTSIRLSQAVGLDFANEEVQDDFIENDTDLRKQALQELVIDQYPRVVDALVTTLGSRENLFLYLLASRGPHVSGWRTLPSWDWNQAAASSTDVFLAKEWVLDGAHSPDLEW